jgi:HEAT repeat protein
MAAQPNIAELVEKLPPTDKEIEALKAAEKAQQDPAKPVKEIGASKFTGPVPKVADELCEQVLAGGRASVVELIGLVRDPADADFKNYKPEYLLHCLTTFVARPGQEAQRKMFISALVSQVEGAKVSPAVKGTLVRELQWIGGEDAVKALSNLLADEALCDSAASALVAIGNGAGAALRQALPKAQGRCRLVIVQSLGAVRDAKAADALRGSLGDADRDVRLAAAWSLARIGDAQSVDLLLKAADASQGFERIKATQACLLLAENLVGAGQKKAATAIYTHLRDTRTDPKEAYVREGATQALTALAGQLL